MLIYCLEVNIYCCHTDRYLGLYFFETEQKKNGEKSDINAKLYTHTDSEK